MKNSIPFDLASDLCEVFGPLMDESIQHPLKDSKYYLQFSIENIPPRIQRKSEAIQKPIIRWISEVSTKTDAEIDELMMVGLDLRDMELPSDFPWQVLLRGILSKLGTTK